MQLVSAGSADDIMFWYDHTSMFDEASAVRAVFFSYKNTAWFQGGICMFAKIFEIQRFSKIFEDFRSARNVFYKLF